MTLPRVLTLLLALLPAPLRRRLIVAILRRFLYRTPARGRGADWMRPALLSFRLRLLARRARPTVRALARTAIATARSARAATLHAAHDAAHAAHAYVYVRALPLIALVDEARDRLQAAPAPVPTTGLADPAPAHAAPTRAPAARLDHGAVLRATGVAPFLLKWRRRDAPPSAPPAPRIAGAGAASPA